MATNGNALIDELLRRHRNAGPDRIARTLARDVLTQVQRIVNLHKGDDTATASFTPSAGRTLYQNSAIASDIAKIEAVRHEDRDLHEVKFRELCYSDAEWLRRTGKRHELFARIGGSLVAIYPAMEQPVALTVSYVTVPAAVVDGATPIALPDERVPLILDLAEVVVAARARVWGALPDLMVRIRKQLGKPDFEQRGET